MKERVELEGQAGRPAQVADSGRVSVRVAPSRVGKRVVSAYLDAGLRRQFRQVAAALDVSVQDLLEESVKKIIEEKSKALGLKMSVEERSKV